MPPAATPVYSVLSGAILAGCGTLFIILVLVIVILSVCLCCKSRQLSRFVIVLATIAQ